MAVKKSGKTPDEREIFAEIEQRAFELYLERKRNNLPGDEASDWHNAEIDIRAKHTK
jgi:hypothetical protein